MPETTAYKLNGIIVAAAALTMARIAAAHPTCIYGNKASYVGRVMTFCPQHEVACCDEAEEMASKELFYNASATELTGACMVYYKQVGPMLFTNYRLPIMRYFRSVKRSICPLRGSRRWLLRVW